MSIDKDFKYRGRVNEQLAAKYTDWSWDTAEDEIGKALSAAKRMITQLGNTRDTFKYVFSDAQTSKIDGGQQALATLVSDLTALKPWARAYKVHMLDKSEREEIATLKAKAAARWVTDAEVVAEARDLIAFFPNPVSNRAAIELVKADVQALHPGVKVYHAGLSYEGHTALRNAADAIEAGDFEQLRIKTMAVLEDHQFGPGERHQGAWMAGRYDFQTWRAARVPGGLEELQRRRRELEQARDRLDDLVHSARKCGDCLAELQDSGRSSALVDPQLQTQIDGYRPTWQRARDAVEKAREQVKALAARI